MSSISPIGPPPLVGEHPSPKAGSQPLSTQSYYSIIRGHIEHEDNLISTRLNWFITSQSFLFTAYAITAGNTQQPFTGPSHHRLESLLVLIPFVALTASIAIGVGIVGGAIAMHTLRGEFDQYAARLPPIDLPPVQGYRQTRLLGIAAPLVLPVLFLVVWLYLLAKGLHL